MENTTIANILQKKAIDFVKIFTGDIKKEIIKDAYITGGAITSLKMYTGGDIETCVNDYDVYFKSKTVLLNVVRYILKRYHDYKRHEDYYDYIKDFSVVFKDTNGNMYQEYDYIADDSGNIFLSLNIPKPLQGMLKHPYHRHEAKLAWLKISYFTEHSINLGKYQIITRFVGDSSEVHKYFDFEHVKGHYSFKEGIVHTPDSMIRSILNKKLVYTGSKYPLKSIFRTIKFIKRGWGVDKMELLKMVFQLYKLDLTNPDVLKDQLTGVYGTNISNYFASLHDGGIDSDIFADIIDTLNNEVANKTYEVEEDSPSIIDFLNKFNQE